MIGLSHNINLVDLKIRIKSEKIFIYNIIYYIQYIQAFSYDAIAHVSTRANLSAREICRTHEKSYSAEKILFIEYSSFNLRLCLRAQSLK